MAYLNTIPQAGDYLAISQAQLLENASQLEIQFSVDHDSLLAAGATGKHFKLTMPERVAPFPTTGVDEGALYTAEGDSETELYFRTESNGFTGKISNMINAYVSFVGATAAIIASHNVDSVTRTAEGFYVINFTAGTFTNSEYVSSGMLRPGVGRGGSTIDEDPTAAKTVITFPCVAVQSNVSVFDPEIVYLTFIGGR